MNDASDNYVVADILGGSQSFGPNVDASQIFSLTDTGIAGVTISSATTNFGISQSIIVTFSESPRVALEPVTLCQ